jgi:hypothetical protein
MVLLLGCGRSGDGVGHVAERLEGFGDSPGLAVGAGDAVLFEEFEGVVEQPGGDPVLVAGGGGRRGGVEAGHGLCLGQLDEAQSLQDGPTVGRGVDLHVSVAPFLGERSSVGDQ